jgi:transglutaminase-like putative cysteine protease
MNHRLTLAAAVAVILASVSIFSLIDGAAWYVQACGAVVIMALAGTLTRISPVPAAIGASVLAVIASVPFLAASSPYLKATGAGIVLLCAASASGLRPLRVVAGLVTYLAALLIYLNLVHAAAQSFLYVIPSPHSVHHLAKLVSDGSSAGRFAPPVPGHQGVILLAAGSIGLVAVAVDFLAVRLHRPAIAGLPLLVLFMAPIATTANMRGLASAVAFLLAAIGYLALLSSDGRSRLRGWGRVVTVWHYAGDDERLAGADMGALAATGRRIGMAAVCAALIAPLLVPGLDVHRLFGHGSGGGGGGSTGVGLPNPVVQLHGLLTKSKTRTVLKYHTTIADPANYLQVYVLNYNSKASEWGLVEPSHGKLIGRGPLAPAPGLAPGTPENVVSTRVSIPSSRGFTGPINFLPVPYVPMRANVPGSWRQEPGTLMIYSDSAPTDGLQYTVTSGEVEPTTATLAATAKIPAAIQHQYMGFRSGVTGQLRDIAQQITRGKTTPFEKAVALEQWFLSNRFSYSIQSNLPNTARGLLTFLTSDRQGFCQQFAFAMAVLARLVGIPSRVAIGFTAGHQHADGTWVVTTADAHAWPELYFTGAGWLRFEPTPGGAAGQQTAVEPAYVTGSNSSGGQKNGNGGTNNAPSSSASPGSATNNIGAHVHQGPGSGVAGDVGGAGHGGPPIGWIILAVLVVITAVPGTARAITRRRHWRSASGDAGLAGAAWHELCADLDDYGMHCRPSESPRALARRIGANSDLDDQARQALGRIATVVERARYAPSPAAAGAVRSDVTSVRRSLARSSSRGARWRARLLPASTLRPVRAWFRQATGLLTGWAPASGES